MNKILELKGTFNYKGNKQQAGTQYLPKGKVITTSDLKRLKISLEETLSYWKKVPYPIPALVSVYYIDVVAKSHRLSGLLVGSDNAKSIVGAKYSEHDLPRHIITHCVEIAKIEEALEALDEAISILDNSFQSKITNYELKLLIANKVKCKSNKIKKHRFVKIIRDAYYVDHFGVECIKEDVTEAQIVNLYDIGIPFDNLLKMIGLKDEKIFHVNESTLLLLPKQFLHIKSVAPYLISMATSDIYNLQPVNKEKNKVNKLPFHSISEPTNEPYIGVIDTLFDEDVYFSSYVEYTSLLPKEEQTSKEDYFHGTAVTSIIVDGPALNPGLDDGCGHFRVKHFAVACGKRTNASLIMERIKKIVENNTDIKVWNFSLGSNDEISKNFISPEAAMLDELQSKYDLIFVIAGTNDRDEAGYKRIGMPADSINSIVVNSVDYSGTACKYSRKGPVLSFFHKPDISTLGGTKEDQIKAYYDSMVSGVYGTSFAAPWISRKLAYLMYILDLPREVAKALIIDSAAGWNETKKNINYIGFGTVPFHINDIINSKDDEIKFFLYGRAKEYDTYVYNIPVPKSKDSFPFAAKATLCYSPKCSRVQGVDYTLSEMDFHFGRMKDNEIETINNNKQGDEGFFNKKESQARRDYRKWDNVKHISEKCSLRSRPKKSYNDHGFWGISIKTKERLNKKNGKNMPFGVVITLKEIKGKNRIDEFKALIRAYHEWSIREIDAEVALKTYAEAESIIEFDE